MHVHTGEVSSSPISTARASLIVPLAALLAALFLAVAGPGPVAGQTPQPRIVYTVSGATYDDGGTLSGSFTFDPNVTCVFNDCQAYSNISLTTTGGNAAFPDPLTYTDANLTAQSGQPFVLALTPESTFIFDLTFGSLLGTAETVPLNGDQWDGVGISRTLVAGSLVGVEEAPPPTDPPATDPPATDPPATDPPVTDPSATDPPVATDPPSNSTTTTAAPGATDPPTGSTTTPAATTPPSTSPSGGVGSESPTATPLPVTGSGAWPTFLVALVVLGGGVALVRLSRTAE